MTKPSKNGNIRLKRAFQLTNSTSLAITLPQRFIHKLNIKPGTYLACELKDDDKSILVEGLKVG